MTKLLLSGLACCALLFADFNAPAWRLRRPISLYSSAPVSEFTVDAALYHDSAANLDDVRILRDQTETPYVLVALTGSRQSSEFPVAILNKAFLPGVGVQAILDLKHHIEHNRLRVVTPLHNFKENLRIETSDDARTWALVEAEAIIFDVLRDDHAASETTVAYPNSNRRYLRVTIPGWKEPASLQGVWLSAYKETGATRDALATLTPTIRDDTKAQTTELSLDLGSSGQPFDRIALSVDPGLFSRTVEVSVTNDLQHWLAIAGGVISRTAEGELLTLTIPERTERYVKVSVFNADNAPLHFGSITLGGIRRIVKFPSNQAGHYFVYIGNPSARPPTYDFARVLPTDSPGALAKVGVNEPNPSFRLPDRPWTDRNPRLLNGALILAVVAMGLVTIRMVKKIS